ncbi:MAG: RNA-binding S4 domain-containing protein [Bacteroidota bacterium]
METFELDDYGFIELNKLLKIMGLAITGGEAKQLIDDGQVYVNGAVEMQRRKKLRQGDVVKLGDTEVKVV